MTRAKTSEPAPRTSYDGTPLKRIEFMVLAVLSEGTRHGYGITQDIDARTGHRERLRPGSLYRVLDRLMRRGLLARADMSTLAQGDEERRTYYEITRLGQDAVRREAAVLAGMAGGVLEHAPGRGAP